MPLFHCWSIVIVVKFLENFVRFLRLTLIVVHRGFKLDATFVIHTVGPVYNNKKTSAPELASAYSNSMKLANEKV